MDRQSINILLDGIVFSEDELSGPTVPADPSLYETLRADIETERARRVALGVPEAPLATLTVEELRARSRLRASTERLRRELAEHASESR